MQNNNNRLGKHVRLSKTRTSERRVLSKTTHSSASSRPSSRTRALSPRNIACSTTDKKPMTLDEAIAHCRHVASNSVRCACADEHRQLAEWLSELKSRRGLPSINPCDSVSAPNRLKTTVSFSAQPIEPTPRHLVSHTLMDFSSALLAIKRGNKVSRLSWLDGSRPNQPFLSLHSPSPSTDFSETSSPHSPDCQGNNHTTMLGNKVLPCIVKSDNSEITLGWLPSSEDLFASDFFCIA